MRPNVKIIIIVFVQILIIIGIYLYFYQKKHKINITIIDKKNIEKPISEELKYFYDNKKNDTSKWSHRFVNEQIVNTHNSDGLNETREYNIQKDKNTFRIITLGDSFTYGVYLNTKDNWTEILERKLNENKLCKNINKFEILNFGVSGYDPLYEVEKYKNVGQKYNPDLIIWMLVDESRFVELQTPEINKCMDKSDKNDYSADVKCWLKNKELFLKKYTLKEIVEIQKRNIEKIRQFYDGQIFFIDYRNTHQEMISNFPNSFNFNKINTNEFLYKKYSESQVNFPDTHPNKLGHQEISNIIFNQLFKNNQIPCEPFEQK